MKLGMNISEATINTVCFSHGKESGPWGTKITALARVAEELGFSVISLDYHGENNPEVRVNQLCSEFVPGNGLTVLVGSSMGGYVATAASDHFKPDGLFLMAPAFGLKGYKQPEQRPAARKISVVHGWDDDIVPYRNALDFAATYHAALHLLDDGHTLTNSIPEICDLFRNFLVSLLHGASAGQPDQAAHP